MGSKPTDNIAVELRTVTVEIADAMAARYGVTREQAIARSVIEYNGILAAQERGGVVTIAEPGVSYVSRYKLVP